MFSAAREGVIAWLSSWSWSAKACLGTLAASLGLILVILLLAVVEADYLAWHDAGARRERGRTARRERQRRHHRPAWWALPIALPIVAGRLFGLALRHLVYTLYATLSHAARQESWRCVALEIGREVVESGASLLVRASECTATLLAGLQPVMQARLQAVTRSLGRTAVFLKPWVEACAAVLFTGVVVLYDVALALAVNVRGLGKEILHEQLLHAIQAVEVMAHVLSSYLLPGLGKVYRVACAGCLQIWSACKSLLPLTEPLLWLTFLLSQTLNVLLRRVWRRSCQMACTLQPLADVALSVLATASDRLREPVTWAVKDGVSTMTRPIYRAGLLIRRASGVIIRLAAIVGPPLMAGLTTAIRASYHLQLYMTDLLLHSSAYIVIADAIRRLDATLLRPAMACITSTFPLLSAFAGKARDLTRTVCNDVLSASSELVRSVEARTETFLRETLVLIHDRLPR